MKTNNINEFIFEDASYRIKGKYGDIVVLHINYKNNKFEIEGNPIPATKKEVNKIAKDLLKRKSGKNFAELEKVTNTKK